MATTDASALQTFPELQHLIDLRAAGWTFVHLHDDHGQVRQINGVHEDPAGDHIDGVRVRDVTDAAAVRWARDGRILWEKEGSLAEVVTGLLSLPGGELS